MTLKHHEYLYHPGDPSNEVYFVKAGILLQTTLLADGREVGVLLSNDNIFGFLEV